MRCQACGQQCCKFLYHKSPHEGAKGTRCKYDARLSNQVWFCKQKHGPQNIDDVIEIEGKKLDIKPSFMDLKGKQYFCRSCGQSPIATDYVRSGLFYLGSTVNPDKERNIEEYIIHCFPPYLPSAEITSESAPE